MFTIFLHSSFQSFFVAIANFFQISKWCAGGVISIKSSTFTSNGILSASGVEALTDGSNPAGGASGGSILIQTSHWQGQGSIAANGGAGDGVQSDFAGGGSGGRIAVHYITSSFSGTLSAAGGVAGSSLAGSTDGGPGTIYTQDYTTNFKKLSVGNAGRTITPLILLLWPSREDLLLGSPMLATFSTLTR